MAWITRHPLPVSFLAAALLLLVGVLVLLVFFGGASGEGGVTVTSVP